MKLKYEAFDSPALVTAIRKLYLKDDYPEFPKSAYKVKRICDWLEREFKTFLELRKQADTEEKKKDLYAMEVETKWEKITEEELTGLKFSPAELPIIEAISTLGDSSQLDA